MKIDKGHIITALVSFVLGITAGYFIARSSTTGDGAYFCCDREGNNCVLAGASCGGKLQWCAKYHKDESGAAICDEWGP